VKANRFIGLLNLNAFVFFQVDVISDVGGSDLEELIKRSMKFLLAANVARELNLSGQSGKRGFGNLLLFEVIYSK
jgi:hypothetical protein